MSVFTGSRDGCLEGGILWSALGFRMLTLAPVSTRNVISVFWTHPVISGPLFSSWSVFAFTDGCTSLVASGEAAVLRLASPAAPRFPAAVGCWLRRSHVENGQELHMRDTLNSQQAVFCHVVSRVILGLKSCSSQPGVCLPGLSGLWVPPVGLHQGVASVSQLSNLLSSAGELFVLLISHLGGL